MDPILQTITLSGFCLQLLPYHADIVRRIDFFQRKHQFFWPPLLGGCLSTLPPPGFALVKIIVRLDLPG